MSAEHPYDDDSDEPMVKVTAEGVMSDSARDILGKIVPAALKRFLAKNKDYGDNHRESKYGLKGELIGLDRKLGKLYNAIWLEQGMNHEGPEEMLDDLFGQVLLMLDLLSLERVNNPESW